MEEQNSLPEVIVINLKRAVARRNFMTKQLKSQRVRFSFFEAKDGNIIDDKWIEENVEYSFRKLYYSGQFPFVNKGALGCADSHRQVWRLIVEKDPNKVFLILEDDCFIPTTAMDVIRAACGLMIRERYDFVLPFYTLNKALVLEKNISSIICGAYRLYPYPANPLGNATAYQVTATGAAKLLSSQAEHITRMADAWDFDEVGVKAGIVYPLVFQTGDFPSTMKYAYGRQDIRRFVYALLVRIPFICSIARSKQKSNTDSMITVI